MSNKNAKKEEFLKRQMDLLDKLGVLKENKNNENNPTILYSKEGADGNKYAIVQEQSFYFIKIGNTLNEDYDYIGGLENKTKEKYNTYADALKRFNLKLESVRDSVISQEIKTSNIGILSENVADETKQLLANKKKNTEVIEPTPATEETPEVEMDIETSKETVETEMETEPNEEVPMGAEPEMSEEPIENETEDETGDGDTVKEIQKLLGKLSQKLSVTDLTPSLTKNVLNTVISSTKGGISELEDDEKEKLSDRIVQDGEKIEEEMLNDDNNGDDIIFEIETDELNETAVPETWVKIEKLKEYLGEDGLLDSLLRAMDDDSVNDALNYIAQMNEINLNDDDEDEDEIEELEEGMWDGVKGLFGKAKSDAVESGAEIKDTAKDLGKSIVNTAKNVYKSVADDVKQTAGEYKKAYTDASNSADLKKYQDELTKLNQKAKELNQKIVQLGGQKRRIMNIGETEEMIHENDMNDDEYLNSTDYFVETYFNGQFSQLKEMLSNFRAEGKMDELLNHLNEMELWEIKDWIIKN
jgi:hypothetical protein